MLLAIVTVLARRLSVAELGAYGLVASLAGYLLVLRNSVARRRCARWRRAVDPAERGAHVLAAAAALYALVGLATGLLIAARALADRRLDPRRATWPRDARAGGARPRRGDRGRDRAPASASTRCAPSASSCAPRATEIAAVALYLATDARADPRRARASGADRRERRDAALQRHAVGARGAPRRRSACASGRRRRRGRASMAIVPTAGWLLVVELSNLAMYAFGRVILGALPVAHGGRPVRGPGARAQPALRAGRGARRAGGPDRLALRGDRRRAPPARARRARHPLHARAVRAGLRDADGAGRADPRGLARRPLRATAPRRWRSSSPTGCSTAGWWSRPGFLVGAGRAREVARIMVCAALRSTWCCRSCSRPSSGSRARRSPPRSRSSSRSRSCCGSGCARRACRSRELARARLAARATRSARVLAARAGGRPARARRRDALPPSSALAGRAACSPTGPRSTALVLDRDASAAAAQAPRLSSRSSGASRSRSETSSSSPSGHSIPTSGSSKRKPDSLAGS